MPYLTTAIQHNVPEFEAWRWAFFVPGACHVIIAALVMCAATDLPDGATRVTTQQHAACLKRGKETALAREVFTGMESVAHVLAFALQVTTRI